MLLNPQGQDNDRLKEKQKHQDLPFLLITGFVTEF